MDGAPIDGGRTQVDAHEGEDMRAYSIEPVCSL
jgi:hypothetical protein